MIVDLVSYRVKKGREQEFEKHVEDQRALMRRTRGFISHLLMRNAEDPGEYHAWVRWVNRDYRDGFRSKDDAEHSALSQAAGQILEGAPTHRLLEVI